MKVKMCPLGCQKQVTSILTMFDIQDKILYTLQFKLQCKRSFLYTYYTKYLFPVGRGSETQV